MAHAHRLHHGRALVDAARVVLTAAGERWTAMREAVYDTLVQFERPASAYDIAEAISLREERRVAANSVYRILDLFVANNLVLRIESANAYVANAHPGCIHDCIFLICDACGETTHVDEDLIADAVRKAARNARLTPERLVLEVRGRCEACKGN